MEPVIVFNDSLDVCLRVGPDIADITDELNQLAKRSGVEDGNLFATVIGSTGSITTIEYEPGVVEDLKRAISSLAPPDQPYAHEAAWHDGNGHSHVQAALMGPSIALPIRQGGVKLGTWQQVVVINHDNKPRNRKVEVTVLGNSK